MRQTVKINMKNLKFDDTIETRVILRQSTDGSIVLAEDINAYYVIVKDNGIVGRYERKTDAIAEFGRLTRIKHA